MKKLGKKEYLAIVENYAEVKEIVYQDGRYSRNTTISPNALMWLYENNIITEKEVKAVKANHAFRKGLITREECLAVGKNLNAEELIIRELENVLDKFCSGCSVCRMNCKCDNIRLMAAKKRVEVYEGKWMAANGAGGGSLPYPRNLEIPEICAKDMCKGLGWTMRDFNREMQ